jgi:hypothetical protein
MRDPLHALEEDARGLANHNLRHVHAVRRHLDAVVSKLEGHRQAGLVHLWQPAADPAREMDVVVGVGSDLQEKLTFLGCYYCLQFLRMSVGSVDSLRLSLASPMDRSSVEREFMLKTGTTFRTLSGSYMRKLLDLFLRGKEVPSYAIVGVGTKADLEDIDVGVIDDGGPGRDNLNDAIARMSSEMLRYATSLHFHISEHVGERGYTAAIPEYRAMLDNSVHDFVIISEMLGGALITGDPDLFHEFQTSVVSRYYFRPGEDQKWHEGYLRGMLGELRSLLGRPLASERIYPKDDGLRTIKGLLSVLKTIYQVGEVNAWRIVDALKRKIPEHAGTLGELERSLSFLEVFRFIYQLVVAQEEEIYLDDQIMQDNMDNVADILGYRKVGTIRPGTHLLVDYYEHIENVRKHATSLFPLCTDHLKRTTVFGAMFSPSYSGNVAVDFARKSEFFRGTTFWRDFIEMLEQDDSRLLRRYIADLDTLPDMSRRAVVGALADRADYALGTVMAVIVILFRNRNCDGCAPFLEELSAAFSARLKSVPYVGVKLIELFYRRPRLVNRYLLSLGDSAVVQLTELLDTDIWDPEVVLWRNRLQNLLDVHTGASRYFHRFLERAGDAYPACLTSLDDQSALEDVSRGILAAAEVEDDPAVRKGLLGEYYDTEFLRIGLGTLAGERASSSDAKFTRVADTYVDNLFEICKLEVDRDERFRVATHDLLAIYATGGLGREQAYDDDFDLMILLNTDHEDVRAYAGRIAAKMNAEIIKRGALPHYRFADHFGHYVTTLSELECLLDSEVRDAFVDRSQMLEARMVVGTRRFADVYWRRIISGHLFRKRLEYVRSMRQEIASRHADAQASGVGSADVKDGIGGLRDVLMLLLMYKAAFRLRHPVNSGLIPVIAQRDPEHIEELTFLSRALEFLKDLRNAYRLAVGAEDELRSEYFDVVAKAMCLEYCNEADAAERLFHEYRACTEKVAATVDVLSERLESALAEQRIA